MLSIPNEQKEKSEVLLHFIPKNEIIFVYTKICQHLVFKVLVSVLFKYIVFQI